ncbi:MAG TPA: septal ring lytic transglycosylase RlpA family protein [Usitatibacter sp.]|nr:septal ring lytic transglycosylase RlpA family protein [Usitatibacter sp.]
MKRAGACRALRLAPCALLLLAGCAGPLKKPDTAAPAAGGKYYQDDGPPDAVPDGLGELPDAVPRDEPFHKYANRPYTVFGQTYVPIVNKDAFKQRGLASWYGRKFQGQKTSSGETYDMFAMTAAHKTLPIPSYAKVTNVRNGKSVVVRINDRGPFHSNRIIDLSYAAAKRIDILGVGSAMVEVERVFPSSDGTPPTTGDATRTAATPAQATVETPMLARDAGGLWLQLGAFGNAQSAEQFRDQVKRDLPWMREPVQVSAAEGLHRVRLGPYKSLEEAAAVGDKVRRSLGYAPVLVEH